MEFFIKNDFGFIEEKYPPDEIVQAFKEVYNVADLPEYKLTPRMEAEIEKLATVLASIPDDLLMDMMSQPESTHEMPETWV